MRFTTKTEYGLICLVQLANLYERQRVVPTKEMVAKEHYPLPYIEKIFQNLRNAGVVSAHHGKHGGYSLARSPSDITLKDIVDALEGSTFDIFCETGVREHIVCTHLCICGMKPVWKKTKQLLDDYYDSITLDAIAKCRTVEFAPTASVLAGGGHV